MTTVDYKNLELRQLVHLIELIRNNSDKQLIVWSHLLGKKIPNWFQLLKCEVLFHTADQKVAVMSKFTSWYLKNDEEEIFWGVSLWMDPHQCKDTSIGLLLVNIFISVVCACMCVCGPEARLCNRNSCWSAVCVCVIESAMSNIMRQSTISFVCVCCCGCLQGPVCVSDLHTDDAWLLDTSSHRDGQRQRPISNHLFQPFIYEMSPLHSVSCILAIMLKVSRRR